MPTGLSAITTLFEAGAFLPVNQTLIEIYGQAWQDYGFVIDQIQPFKNKLEPLSFFGKFNYLAKHGYSLNDLQPTKIQLMPLTFGLKWLTPIHEKVTSYVGIAPRYYFMKISNDSTYVPQHTKSNHCGAYFTIGAFFYPKNNLVIELLADYSYIKFAAPPAGQNYFGFATNASGVGLSTGIGYQF